MIQKKTKSNHCVFSSVFIRVHPWFLLCLLFLTAPAFADIDFYDNLETAQLLAPDQTKPIMLQFGASWCGWCHKMEGSTFTDKRVEELAKKFICVKIDIDEQQDVAATYHVRGVPQTTVIDHDGKTMVSQSGYMPAEKFVPFLNSGLDAYNAAQAERAVEAAASQPDGAATQPENGATAASRPAAPDLNETIKKMVELLAKPQRSGRERIMSTLAKAGEKAWPALISLLDDDRLSVRAAAAYALKQLSKADLPFDAFAEKEKRDAQAKTWQDWIAKHASPSAPLPQS